MSTDHFLDVAGRSPGDVLSHHKLRRTQQRVTLLALIWQHHPFHFTADELYRLTGPSNALSVATVYNTLNIFLAHGLISEVVTRHGERWFDSTTTAHHHLYNVDTQTLTDIPTALLSVAFMESFGDAYDVDKVDVIVHVRDRTSQI
ncbi:MAG: transcriptional repressor [Alphaproteobacteria bacterium]|nr:transcriptional repressor [Alphaproteobacteria bacterium]